MPTYDYLCRIGHRFELFMRMSDPPEAKCPECGEVATRQITGGAGFIFKGDGFYITDYRSDSYRKAAKADSGEASDAEKGSSRDSSGNDRRGRQPGNKERASGAGGGGDGSRSAQSTDSASGSTDGNEKRRSDA